MVINIEPPQGLPRCSIPTHLLMNMECIFHLGADDTESSFGNEKLKLFNEAFHVDENIFRYNEAKQETR